MWSPVSRPQLTTMTNGRNINNSSFLDYRFLYVGNIILNIVVSTYVFVSSVDLYGVPNFLTFKHLFTHLLYHYTIADVSASLARRPIILDK